MHKLRFFFDIKFSGKHAGRCFQLFQISVFPDPRIASVPIDGTGTGITRPLIDLILIRRLRDQCLHKELVQQKVLSSTCRTHSSFVNRYRAKPSVQLNQLLPFVK